MSSSSVCQGLRSCLEPWLTEPCLDRLKSIPSKPSPSRENNTTTIIKTNDDCNTKSEKAEDTAGGWSFLQCLTNTSNTTINSNKKEAADGNEKVYVHPFVKRSSSSMLSEKSLEMCTESLGSETGSLVSESTISPTAGINSYTPATQPRESNLVKKRTNRSLTTFPPPLTSISCSNRVQVRPHREGGRLVLQAVTDPSSPPAYFQAERSDGRLRLCLVKDLDPSPNEADDDDDNEDVDADDEDEEEEEEEEEDCCDHVEKDRGEIGIENLPRPSRCYEGGRGAGNRLIWEAFLVST